MNPKQAEGEGKMVATDDRLPEHIEEIEQLVRKRLDADERHYTSSEFRDDEARWLIATVRRVLGENFDLRAQLDRLREVQSPEPTGLKQVAE